MGKGKLCKREGKMGSYIIRKHYKNKKNYTINDCSASSFLALRPKVEETIGEIHWSEVPTSLPGWRPNVSSATSRRPHENPPTGICPIDG